MEYSDIAQYGFGYASVMDGWQEPIKFDNVTAGQDDVSRTIPGETWEYFELGTFNLVTDANGGSRYTHWYIKDGDGDTVYETSASTGVAVSSSILAYAGPTVSDNTSGSGITKANMPSLLLPSGWTVGFHIVGMDAGDTVTPVVFIMRRIPSDIASGDTYHRMREILEASWKKLVSGQGATPVSQG